MKRLVMRRVAQFGIAVVVLAGLWYAHGVYHNYEQRSSCETYIRDHYRGSSPLTFLTRPAIFTAEGAALTRLGKKAMFFIGDDGHHYFRILCELGYDDTADNYIVQKLGDRDRMAAQ